MARRQRVQIADPSGDQPSAWALLAIAIVALGGGVSAAQWLASAPAAGATATNAAPVPAPAPSEDAGAGEGDGQAAAVEGSPSAERDTAAPDDDPTSAPPPQGGQTAAPDPTSPTSTEPAAAEPVVDGEVATGEAATGAEAVVDDAAATGRGEPAATGSVGDPRATPGATRPAAAAASAAQAAVARTRDVTANAPPVEATATPAASPNQPARGAPMRRFVRGHVVYVRCEGLERRGKRFPCPRDRKLEERLWSLLEGRLPGCVTARGSADLRFEFRRRLPPSYWVRTRGALAADAVEKCVGEDLSRARTDLLSDRMIISFRFSLE